MEEPHQHQLCCSDQYPVVRISWSKFMYSCSALDSAVSFGLKYVFSQYRAKGIVGMEFFTKEDGEMITFIAINIRLLRSLGIYATKVEVLWEITMRGSQSRAAHFRRQTLCIHFLGRRRRESRGLFKMRRGKTVKQSTYPNRRSLQKRPRRHLGLKSRYRN